MVKKKRRYTKAQKQAFKQALGYGDFVPIWKSDSVTSPNTVCFDPCIPFHGKYSTTSSADFGPAFRNVRSNPSAVVQANRNPDTDDIRGFLFPATPGLVDAGAATPADVIAHLEYRLIGGTETFSERFVSKG